VDIKLKELMLFGSLFLASMTVNASVVEYSGTFDATSDTVGNFVGEWSFNADLSAYVTPNTIYADITLLDTLVISSGPTSLTENDVLVTIRTGSNGELLQIWLNATTYSGPAHPSFDDFFANYSNSSGNLTQFKGSLASAAAMDTAFAITSGSFSASAVPVPAAVWLFGSGLLGLVSIARRKKA